MRIEIEVQKETEKIVAELKIREIDFQVKDRDKALEIEDLKHKMEKLKAEPKLSETTTTSKFCTIRLPKFELKKFGQILKWQEFWDTFEATIHRNPILQPIDKFTYS